MVSIFFYPYEASKNNFYCVVVEEEVGRIYLEKFLGVKNSFYFLIFFFKYL